MTITARVRRDGALAIRKRERDALGQQEGGQVQITLIKPPAPSENSADDPLLEIIGIGKEGPKDSAEDHGTRLYQHPTP